MSNQIKTHTELMVSPLTVELEQINIEDIAHSLSLQCRFTGHCPEFYSVAQHSVTLSRLTTPENALAALLHDAGEAYIGDVATPIKQHTTLGGQPISELEDKILGCVYTKFGLPPQMPGEVKYFDRVLTLSELAQFFKGFAMPEDGVEVTEFWDWKQAKIAFLSRFSELTRSLPDA